MSISEFEIQRLANIERNRNLLKLLNLNLAKDALAESLTPKATPTKRRSPRRPSAKRDTPEPSRRSRRIAGANSEQENTEEYQKAMIEQDERNQRLREIERLRLTRLFGDFSLMDLITDAKLGLLAHESRVIRNIMRNAEDTVKCETLGNVGTGECALKKNDIKGMKREPQVDGGPPSKQVKITNIKKQANDSYGFASSMPGKLSPTFDGTRTSRLRTNSARSSPQNLNLYAQKISEPDTYHGRSTQPLVKSESLTPQHKISESREKKEIHSPIEQKTEHDVTDGKNPNGINHEYLTGQDKREFEVLDTLRSLGNRFSTEGLYTEIRGTSLDYTNAAMLNVRSEFDSLKIFPIHDPHNIKVTHTRITAIAFHHAVNDRVIVAADTTGHVGIWAVDATLENSNDIEDKPAIPTISILKPHGKAVSKVQIPFEKPTKIYTASYDGSVRVHDLLKLSSSEVAYINDPWEHGDYPLGVSDINFCANLPHILYMTTLSGGFYQHDVRVRFDPVMASRLLRLHDKKIGGFAINPNALHQIATASLDRTLKVWDLRNISKSNASWLDYDDQTGPHIYQTYTSRLSVSCVDWNKENRLVCNGYDDKINIFNLSGSNSVPCVTYWSKTFVPSVAYNKNTGNTDNLTSANSISHNCQTGRWVSILKLRWQQAPQDGVQKFIIANMNRGLDVYDQQGNKLAHLSEDVGAVPAVSTLHPTRNWAVGGLASGKLYLFT